MTGQLTISAPVVTILKMLSFEGEIALNELVIQHYDTMFIFCCHRNPSFKEKRKFHYVVFLHIVSGFWLCCFVFISMPLYISVCVRVCVRVCLRACVLRCVFPA